MEKAVKLSPEAVKKVNDSFRQLKFAEAIHNSGIDALRIGMGIPDTYALNLQTMEFAVPPGNEITTGKPKSKTK